MAQISYTDIARDVIVDFETRNHDLVTTEVVHDEDYGSEVYVTFENKAERRIEQALRQAVEASKNGELLDD